jgi:hypothetical protein
MDLVLVLFVISSFVTAALVVFYYVAAVKSIFGSVLGPVPTTEFVQVFVLNSSNELTKEQRKLRLLASCWLILFAVIVLTSRLVN